MDEIEAIKKKSNEDIELLKSEPFFKHKEQIKGEPIIKYKEQKPIEYDEKKPIEYDEKKPIKYKEQKPIEYDEKKPIKYDVKKSIKDDEKKPKKDKIEKMHTYIDTTSDSSSDTGSEVSMLPDSSIHKKNFEHNVPANSMVSKKGEKITTEGIKYTDSMYKKNKDTLSICDYCGLVYEKNMIQPTELGDLICQHCYFFINFDDPQTKYGWTLEKYIETCHANHSREKCKKFANGGGCHLCLYLMDIDTQTKSPTINNSVKQEDNLRKILFSSGINNKRFKISVCNKIEL